MIRPKRGIQFFGPVAEIVLFWYLDGIEVHRETFTDNVVGCYTHTQNGNTVTISYAPSGWSYSYTYEVDINDGLSTSQGGYYVYATSKNRGGC